MKKNYYAAFFAVCLFLSAPVFVIAQDNVWKVWVKTSPCSGRYDWITVAKNNPSGGGNFFVLANQVFSSSSCTNFGCSYAQAVSVANSLRPSTKFSEYCCHNYAVWKNIQTGQYTVVLGTGSAGTGWQFVKGDLCCEDAEALSGIPGACSGDPHTQQVQNTKCWPGSYPAWNASTQTVQCFCNPGLVWNSTKTACVDPKDLTKDADCSGYPGSYAAWNSQTQRMECFCPTGKKWNDTKTACINEVSSVNCWPGSYAAVNPQTNVTECYCNPGLVWNKTRTACVDPKSLVNETDCSGYPGSYAAWNEQTQRVECFCPTGKKWNDTRTACVDNVAQVSCWPGSYAAVNPQTNVTECYCNPGLVWNSTKTACIDPKNAGNTTSNNNNPGTNNSGGCTASDQETFAKMIGVWKHYRKHVTISGSCDHVSGTWKETEWCEGVDATDNPNTKRITGTISGHMDHGILLVHFSSADSPNQKTDNGEGNCYLNGDGTLDCSFGCRVDMTKQ